MTTDDTDVIPVVSVRDDEDEHTGVWWWVSRIASYTLLAVMVLILLATVVVPRVTGSTPYTVLTQSMKPTYPPGSLIVVRPVEPNELAIGTPITYQLRSGEPEVVTHRIVATRQSGAGELTFITRGDNNGADDENPVQVGQIRGEVWYSIPYMGYVNNWLNGEQRKITVAVIVIALFGYALVMFVGAGVDRYSARREPSS